MRYKRSRLILKLVPILIIFIVYISFKIYIDYKCSLVITLLSSTFSVNNKAINSYYDLNEKLIIEPYCKCRKDLTLLRRDDSIVSLDFSMKIKEIASLKFTCGLYNAIKRGGQRVVSYSLYGNDPKYSSKLEMLVKQVSEKYPGFTTRIYYDERKMANRTLRCYLECKYPNLVDFCDVSHFYTTLEENLLIRSGKFNFTDLNYIHKMIWRFLPIGDDFVDLFMSRDTDSIIIDREVLAVDEWISESNNIGHIMRDHEGHMTEILGGMWGFKNSLDRSLARYIFSLIVNKNLAGYYNPKEESQKGYDQKFLTHYVYPFILNRATIHDSYYCSLYSNSRPFPSKRFGFSYVANILAYETYTKECPIQCRPKFHQDWIYC